MTVVKIDLVVFWDVVQCSVVWLPSFWKIILPPPSGLKCLKTEAAWSSKPLVSNHYTTLHNNPEAHEFTF
jgi:hypothetical protein